MADFNSSLPVRTQTAGDVKIQVVDYTTNTQGMTVNVDGSINAVVSATNLDIRDLSSTQDNVKAQLADGSGNYYSALNPLAVTVTGGTAGDGVNSYHDDASIAAGSSVNQDYTVTAGKTLALSQIEGSASGKAKFEIQVETGVASGSFNTVFVLFNSTAAPNVSLHIEEPISVAAGVRVRVIKTNKDMQAQDIYATISGREV